VADPQSLEKRRSRGATAHGRASCEGRGKDLGRLRGDGLGLIEPAVVLGKGCNFSLQHLDQAGVGLAKRVQHIDVFQGKRIRAFFATEKDDTNLVVFIGDNLSFDETQSCSEHL